MAPQPQQFGPMWRALRDRLATLELQIAQLGDSYAPTHMLVERDQLQTELEMIKRANEPRPSQELYAAVDQHIRDQAVMSAVMSLSGRVYELQADQRRSNERFDRFQDRLLWLLPICILLAAVITALICFFFASSLAPSVASATLVHAALWRPFPRIREVLP